MGIEHVRRSDGTIGDLITCDVCGARMHDEAIDWEKWDWSWLRLYVQVGSNFDARHVCARCRTQVVWCGDCQTFHYKSGTHYVKCERCGRTYRAFVDQTEHLCATCAGLDENHPRWWLEAISTSRHQPDR